MVKKVPLAGIAEKELVGRTVSSELVEFVVDPLTLDLSVLDELPALLATVKMMLMLWQTLRG